MKEGENKAEIVGVSMVELSGRFDGSLHRGYCLDDFLVVTCVAIMLSLSST